MGVRTKHPSQHIRVVSCFQLNSPSPILYLVTLVEFQAPQWPQWLELHGFNMLPWESSRLYKGWSD